jgi:hypothetical protein
MDVHGFGAVRMPNRRSTNMVGGSATQAGIAFQNNVAAFLCVHILADAAIEFVGLPAGVAPTTIELETAAPVDDILLYTSTGGRCFINVKRSVSLSTSPDSPLGSVLDQFVRLWVACHSGRKGHSWQRPFAADRDRLVLITGGTGSSRAVAAASKILGRIADLGAIAPRESIAKTAPELQAYNAVIGLLHRASERHTGARFSDDVLTKLLTMTRVASLDPEGADNPNLVGLLRSGVVADSADAQAAWRELVAECQRLSENRSGADRATLRNALRLRGIRLGGAPEIAADVRRLEDFTRETLSSLAHLARLDLPNGTVKRRVEIHRAVTDSLVAHAQQASLLIIGEPGSGKSGALFSAANRLIADGHPVVAVAVERHPVTSVDQFRESLRLDAGFIDILRNWPSEKRGVLFIDALDASRGGPSDRVFRELIRRVVEEAPNWNVVASIRVFDLKFGVHYRSLFSGRPVDETYRASEFSNVKHLLVPQLTDQELEQVWSASELMKHAFEQGSPTFRNLVRSPFNLFLLADVLSAGLRDVREITTQLHLLHLYWSYRVIGVDHHGLARESLLKRSLDRMLDDRTLQTAVDADLDVKGDLDRLLSEGVLIPAGGTGDRVTRISFAHHVLFDYSVARLILESGRAPNLAQHLTSSDDRALLVAPSATMALQILWQDDGAQRRLFWTKALEVASATGTGAFCRMLPARTAAALADDVEDFTPVFECLRQQHCSDRAAAVFLVRHCTGALVAGVSPKPTSTSVRGAWPKIVHMLAEADIRNIGWMLKPLIGQWIESSNTLSTEERSDIGATARRMLRHGSGDPYDSSMVIVGIQGVARTFGSEPTESLDALGQLLAREHVIAHGDEELSWIAREFEHLLRDVPLSAGLIRDAYRAGYCTPLPSRDETTNLGRSRILSLRSNRRQDFEHALWELFEQYPRVFAADPQNATETLIDILECFTAQEHATDEEIVSLSFGDVAAQYQSDHSYAWLRRHDNYKAPPVHSFESGLTDLVDSDRLSDLTAVLDTVVRRNRLAALWAAVLRAGVARPDALGRRLMPLLRTPAVLEGRDTRKPAGDLIRVLHPLLPASDQVEIERAILATNEYAQPVLLGCLAEQNVASPEARARRSELQKERPLPPNREPLEISGGWVRQDEDWWLKEQGVDLSTEANGDLNREVRAVEAMKRPEGDDSQKGSLLANGWTAVQTLHDTLKARSDVPEALLMSAWNAIAEVADSAAQVSDSADDLARFQGIRQMVIGALNASLWPLPVPDAEREAAFARSPSWGSPAPRVQAAGAIMALARAEGRPNSELEELIEALARDPSPSVRHQILGRTNMVFDANRPLMWRLCEIGFGEETNEGVLSFFLPAIGHVSRERPEWFVQRLLALDDRAGPKPIGDGRRDEFVSHIVQLLLRLWFIHDQPAAGERVRTWTRDPIAHFTRIQDAISALRGAIVQGDSSPPDPTDDRVRTRTIEIFENIVLTIGPLFERLAQKVDLTDAERETAETALRVLDHVATEIYFGSGAYGGRDRQIDDETPSGQSPEVRSRFLSEMARTLGALAHVPYPSVTHHLLQTLEAFVPDDPPGIFRLVTEVLVSGGRTGEYQLESLGSDLFVKIVRRYLADYRAVIASDHDLRHRLMRALDVFVDAGWPEARRLVYELPEMLR